MTFCLAPIRGLAFDEEASSKRELGLNAQYKTNARKTSQCGGLKGGAHPNGGMPETLQTQVNVIRGLGLVAAASIVVGNMVGANVFLKARVMTCNVETPAMVIAVWVVTGFLTLAGALTLAELATMMPESGGIYVFLREAYGERWGFLYGWMEFVVGSVSIATGGIAFGIFLNVVTSGAFSGNVFAFHFSRVRVSLSGAQAIAVTIIGIVMLVNCAAVSLAGELPRC